MGTISKNLASPAGEADLLTAARAIHDELSVSLAGKLTGMEAKVILAVGEAFKREIDRKINALAAEMVKRIDGLRKSYQESLEQMLEVVKSLPLPKVELSPDIQVNVPAQPPPAVKVDVHPPRATRKHIRYDEQNRPVEITEVSEKE